MDLQTLLTEHIKEAIKSLYEADLAEVEFQATRKEFEGDITVVVFPMLRVVKGNPVAIGEALGAYLVAEVEAITAYNVIKGFLNLSLSDAYFYNSFTNILADANYGHKPQGEDAVIVEYSSPNTNKPLHLGHIRNILLGYSVAEILKAAGNKVYKTQIINDRGIHICKSMLAWQRFGNGETPASSGLKGDHLVGKYYVKFDQEYKAEQKQLMAAGKSESEAKEQAPILLAAQEMLRKWEAGDAAVVELWEMMNSWVYQGFDATYDALGVDFDTLYYESNTYLLGKENIEEGLSKGVFFRKDDGSVWCDLTDEGLDEKLVLRSDGTAVYMTQDIGTAIQRIKDMPDANGMIYTVGNEQDYHFKVLFLILKKLGYSWAENLHHLSYGMVDLPSGKMKSREGTVVDADDLISEMASTAESIASELGKLDGYTEAQKKALYQDIGLGALKYYILKVDPKKRILFDPEASVDFQGNTGPFIQYTYARIQAILRKAETMELEPATAVDLTEKERAVIKELENYPTAVSLAAEQHSPALVANYVYDLVKAYNSFFQNVPIFAADTASQLTFRVQLSEAAGRTIKSALALLGIVAPERM
ncbi:arginine--tRNA ligase [Gilvibacter sp. SZ-19]|uniref:arginine--tRNA ligase n=1 Tax=Gilvibacter sp. SZ-19 TaxID=754429 RepID=UPI000B3C9BF4|nr:arginine--tRNA ligase [Gilvibacter sp. SZ-19]ARV12660.1 arginine--tRNA ligase [Gilvibacter sp. SZ-19]